MGTVYAIFLIFEKYVVDITLKHIKNKTTLIAAKVFIRISSLFVILFAWLIFRLENFSDLICCIQKMLFISGTQTGSTFDFFIRRADVCSKIVFMIPAVFFSFPVYEKIFQNADKNNFVFVLELLFALIAFMLSIALLIGSTYNPFIYFRF